MECPGCKYPESKVVRTLHDSTDATLLYRRRECLRCGNRFTTTEKIRDAKPERK